MSTVGGFRSRTTASRLPADLFRYCHCGGYRDHDSGVQGHTVDNPGRGIGVSGVSWSVWVIGLVQARSGGSCPRPPGSGAPGAWTPVGGVSCTHRPVACWLATSFHPDTVTLRRTLRAGRDGGARPPGAQPRCHDQADVFAAVGGGDLETGPSLGAGQLAADATQVRRTPRTPRRSAPRARCAAATPNCRSPRRGRSGARNGIPSNVFARTDEASPHHAASPRRTQAGQRVVRGPVGELLTPDGNSLRSAALAAPVGSL
jgi:hypothetical protein